MMIITLPALAEPKFVYLNCALVLTSSGTLFSTKTENKTESVRINLSTGIADGGGIASFISQASEFQPTVTNFEIKGSGRGTVAWLGQDTKMYGIFSVNRFSGKYFATSKIEFVSGFTEYLEDGICTKADRAF